MSTVKEKKEPKKLKSFRIEADLIKWLEKSKDQTAIVNNALKLYRNSKRKGAKSVR